ncbi:MAG TPA: 30S ribosomal protein S13 [Dehalococcoidia bacterium]|nr:30S ribosomal protein S13 [Dehalococcoidia bacterium]
MARISGVDIPPNKRIEVSLSYIYGIGPAVSRRILGQTGIDVAKKAKDLTEEEISRLREVIDKGYRVEGDLRKEVGTNIGRLTEIGSYRGMRHRRRLPVRGQRTRTNARTRRGPRQTVAGRGRRRGTAKK